MPKPRKPPPDLHGGRRENAGRPPLDPEERTRITSIRLTAKQHEKFMILGGAAWVRRKLDGA